MILLRTEDRLTYSPKMPYFCNPFQVHIAMIQVHIAMIQGAHYRTESE